MNFLIDANLPRRLVDVFRKGGHNATHTLELPDGNATTDLELLEYADAQDCVIANFDQILLDLASNRFVELTREHVVVHA